MGRPSLLSVCFCLLAAVGLAAVPPNIVAEGVPPVPAALTAELTPYLNLGASATRRTSMRWPRRWRSASP